MLRFPIQNHVFDLFFLTFGISLLYLFCMGSYPLFTPDEGRYTEVAREMVVRSNYITPKLNDIVFLDKPILYYWFQALAIKLFGLNEWAIRFFPFLFGLLGCLATYCCARQLFNRSTAVLASAMLATSPLYFAMAHYANLDLEVAVWITFTLLSFITALQSKGRIRSMLFLGMYVFSAGAFLTKGLIAIAFPGLIILSFLCLQKRLAVLKEMYLGWGILIWLALVLPWIVLVQRENPSFFYYFFINQQVIRFLSAAEFNNQTVWWFYFPILLMGFFPWSVFLLQSIWSSLKELTLKGLVNSQQLFFLLWISIVFLFFSIPHSKIAGYILPIFPPASILTAHYLSDKLHLAKISTVRFTTVSFTFITLALTLGLFFARDILPQEFWPYLRNILVCYAAFALLALFFMQHKNLRVLFLICLSLNIAVLMTWITGAEGLNERSTKSLTTQLKKSLQTKDIIIAYHHFYQDIPIYLQREIKLVSDWDNPNILQSDNWIRELWYGKQWHPENQNLINEAKLWEYWHSDARVFVFLNQNHLPQFIAQAHLKADITHYIVGQSKDILLLSNIPITNVGT